MESFTYRLGAVAVAGPVAVAGLLLAPGGGPAADCPASLRCRFIPAAYASNTPGDPGDYGNLDLANRPADGLTISSIVIHDTEETYGRTVSLFTNPAHYASANYVVASANGDVTEMIRPQDVAWAVGNWYYNTHSVSIENEGFAAAGARWYTKAEYESAARLVRYLAGKYHVPLDRAHIVGHDNVGGATDAKNKTQHSDPGPFWDWNYFMSLVRGESERRYLAGQGSGSSRGHHLVTIAPDFVYLRTGPSSAAPLLSDPYLHRPGSPGTTAITDWGDRAPAGWRYVLAGRKGAWTAIWFGGQIAWFRDPKGPRAAARFTGGWVVTPRPGRASVPVYGAAFPEAAAYPKGIPVRANPALAYRLRAGQAYVTTGAVPATDYYTATYNLSASPDHVVVRGRTRYLQILFNHRLYYVKAADVIREHLR